MIIEAENPISETNSKQTKADCIHTDLIPFVRTCSRRDDCILKSSSWSTTLRQKISELKFLTKLYTFSDIFPFYKLQEFFYKPMSVYDVGIFNQNYCNL